jgi:hypothetical protein
MNWQLSVLAIIVFTLWILMWKIGLRCSNQSVLTKVVISGVFCLLGCVNGMIPYYVGKVALWRMSSRVVHEKGLGPSDGLFSSIADGFSGDKMWYAIFLSQILLCVGIILSCRFCYRLFKK